MQAAELLKAGQLAGALERLEQDVRADPSNAKHRVFLFQLLCVLGQWDRALTQLNVAAKLDPLVLLMAQVGRQALLCEALRREIFAGERAPIVFGEPAEWVGWMVQANNLAATGRAGDAQELRQRALDAAPAIAGSVNDIPFEWLADADVRLGPILEAIVDGRYYWIPFQHIREIQIEPPQDLRDLVWSAARFTWSNGGVAVGLIPTRYPASEDSADDGIRLARRTDWDDRGHDLVAGVGQRIFATDEGEYPILEVRKIALGGAIESEQGGDPAQASAAGERGAAWPS